MREIHARVSARFKGVPSMVVLVPEYCTSKLCPDPCCLGGRDQSRSELKFPKFVGSKCQSFRACWCPTCGTPYNRDAVGVENIYFALIHILTYGWHPWAPRSRLAARLYAQARGNVVASDTEPIFHALATQWFPRTVVKAPPRSPPARASTSIDNNNHSPAGPPGQSSDTNKASAESSSVRPITSGRTSPTDPGAQAAASP